MQELEHYLEASGPQEPHPIATPTLHHGEYCLCYLLVLFDPVGLDLPHIRQESQCGNPLLVSIIALGVKIGHLYSECKDFIESPTVNKSIVEHIGASDTHHYVMQRLYIVLARILPLEVPPQLEGKELRVVVLPEVNDQRGHGRDHIRREPLHSVHARCKA